MASFLLIHGSCHGAWCWRETIAELEALGHRASAIDLPAHGADTAPVEAASAASYVDAILAALEPGAILVGHSLGGMWISAAAEAAPERIGRIVHLCAWAPEDGQSARDVRAAAGADALLAAMEPALGGTATLFRNETLEPLFYHDCPPGTAEAARPLLCPEPAAPTREPVRLGPAHERVKRAYIVCAGDRVVPPAYQRGAAARADLALEMACGHSPFFADPAGLARHLIRTAA